MVYGELSMAGLEIFGGVAIEVFGLAKGMTWR